MFRANLVVWVLKVWRAVKGVRECSLGAVCGCVTEVERTRLIKGSFGSTPAIHFLNVCAADSFKMVPGGSVNSETPSRPTPRVHPPQITDLPVHSLLILPHALINI